MKRLFSFLLPAVLFLSFPAGAQESTCGYDLLLQRLDPAKRTALQAEYASHVKEVLASEAANGNTAGKTTGNESVPVVFHFLITDAQKAELGGEAGIINRVNRQLASLNEDFNGSNADQSLIPPPFKPRFGNAGIRFRLAGANSAYTIAGGIELRTLSSAPAYDFTTGFSDAKRFAEGGLNGWDASKYLNVWVFTPGSRLLGLAVPVRFIGSTFSGSNHVLTTQDIGLVLHYGVVGKRQTGTELYLKNSDLGRTMTHETGHFFNLPHIWGNSSGGDCLVNDNIPDTPPQYEATYCNAPTQSNPNGCPTFPRFDLCTPSGNGIMYMNFMDYVDDAAMMMFTKDQAAIMRADVSANGPLASLTNNSVLAVANATLPANQNLLDLFPNPATTQLTVQSPTGGAITAFTLSDVTGREVFRASQLSQNTISIAGYARGLYFVRATVAGQPFSGKIVLQ